MRPQPTVLKSPLHFEVVNASLTDESREYVLGTGRDELERLQLQHRLWSDVAVSAWRKAGIKRGQTILDVGCGPGFASFDLAELVTSQGKVIALDESEDFVAHVNEQSAVRRSPQLKGYVHDVHALNSATFVPDASVDLAYARWVLCFVADPESVIEGIVSKLRPGGHVVIHEYFNYEVMTTAPRRPAIDKAIAATAASWRARGGDPDVGARLPRALGRLGMSVRSVEAHQRIARPGESMFEWPETWWRTYTPKLVGMGLLSEQEAQETLDELTAMARESNDFWICPAVLEIVARKP